VVLTYAEVGATGQDEMPAGYHHVDRSRVLGHGRAAFDRAAAALADWSMFRRVGFRVPAATPPVAPGVEVRMRLLGVLLVPCRVVYTHEERDRRGFAYGTLPGHPESGEEAFVVTIAASGEVVFRVRAFSRPAILLTRAAGPAGRAAQQVAATRYLRALGALAAGR
jgi:uncharacterized protein (UPF0548 family)